MEVEQEVTTAVESALEGWHLVFARRTASESTPCSFVAASGVDRVDAFREALRDEGMCKSASTGDQEDEGAEKLTSVGSRTLGDLPSFTPAPKAPAVVQTGGASSSESRLNIPEGCQGIVLAADLSDLKTLMQLVIATSKEHTSLPLIALLLVAAPSDGDSPSSQNAESRRIEAVLQAQVALIDAGAEDVVVRQGSSSCNLRLELAMGAKRSQRRRNDLAFVKDKIAQVQRQAQAQAQERELQLAAEGPKDAPQHNKLFWSCVHRIFDGFPKIEPHEIPETLGPGDCIGACELDELLGEGGFGSVYAAINADTQTAEAVKVLRKTTIQDLAKVRNSWREFTVLHKIRHPNIVRLLKVTHTRHHVCIHMELAGTMTMCDYIMDHDILSSEQTWALGQQISAALAYLHRIGIAHRDVKHDNVVLSDSDQVDDMVPIAKLVDFGMALEVSKARAEGQCGTMPFAAPEILQGMMSAPDACAGDVWAFGVLVLDALHGVGKMCRLLGWPEPASVRPDRGEELAQFWTRPDEERVQSLGDMLDKAGGAGGEVDKRFVEVLLGTFNVDLEYRWIMDEVAEWFARCGRLEEEDG